ncbi:309_t:CDS:1 [Ambispora leptoticha]|uniref:309_t:CDS:1 n=1 Tax=Ambispora leptoticha TaxID=144679 RepID=A0A9N8VL57_9GLOM|nr:309_t:CDS:1 [Ambispora leptoticha]
MTNFTSHYNPHAFHNDVKISSTCTPIVNFSANFLDHRFLYDNNPNFFIFNSASIDAANTSIIPTALISLPTSQAQISIPEYLNYDSTYIAGNLSDITFEDV